MECRARWSVCAVVLSLTAAAQEPNFLDETPEQHGLIEKEQKFLDRELKKTNARCGTNLTSIVDYEGIQDGKPKNPNAKSGPRPGAVERVDSMVGEYFSRCTGSIKMLERFCDFDDALKTLAQKKLTHFECRYEATRDGFGDSDAKCPMKVERGGLVATCSWYQRSDSHEAMAKALGVEDPLKPTPQDEADDVAPEEDSGRSTSKKPEREPAATSTKAPAKERCTPASCVEELGPRGVCKFGKCVMGKKVRGDACKSFQECGNNMSCVHGKCG